MKLADFLTDYPADTGPFGSPEDLLAFILGDCSRAAMRIRDPKGRQPKWSPILIRNAALPSLIRQHIQGNIEPQVGVHGGSRLVRLPPGETLGAYALQPDLTAKWICIDIDVAGTHAMGSTATRAREAATATLALLRGSGFAPFLEQSHSGQGWHIWVLFERPVSGECAAWFAAMVASAVRSNCNLPAKMPEAFPKSGKRALASLVALPFTGAPRGPNGGKIFEDDKILPIGLVCLTSASAMRRMIELYRLHCQHQARTQAKRAIIGAADGRASPIHSFTAEEIMRRLRPELINGEKESDLLCNCPRHESRSGISLHVNRHGEGWFCFGCARGGGPSELARWLCPGLSMNKIMAKIEGSNAV